MRAGGHEQVAFCHDPSSGLRTIIAIWSTALGPSLGGCRFQPYPSERAALVDAWGVAEAMKGAAQTVWGTDDMTGRHVAIQGVGKVGGTLARILHDEGARLTLADVDGASVERLAAELVAEVVPPEKVHAV